MKAFIGVFLSCLLLSISSAWAQPYGMGPGMMGGYGYGPGMMGGYGYGPGMMGGYGWGYGGDEIPNLTDEQRQKLSQVTKEYRQRQWQLMEKMHDQAFQSGNFYGDGKFDEQAARKQFDAMTALRKQMFENSLEQRKRIDSLLTSEQRQQWYRGSRGDQ